MRCTAYSLHLDDFGLSHSPPSASVQSLEPQEAISLDPLVGRAGTNSSLEMSGSQSRERRICSCNNSEAVPAITKSTSLSPPPHCLLGVDLAAITVVARQWQRQLLQLSHVRHPQSNLAPLSTLTITPRGLVRSRGG